MFSAVVSRKPYHCNDKGYSASMTGKASLPWHENLPESFPTSEIVIRLIEQAMSKTGTDNCTYEQRVEKRIKKGHWHVLSGKEPFEDIPTEYES